MFWELTVEHINWFELPMQDTDDVVHSAMGSLGTCTVLYDL